MDMHRLGVFLRCDTSEPSNEDSLERQYFTVRFVNWLTREDVAYLCPIERNCQAGHTRHESARLHGNFTWT